MLNVWAGLCPICRTEMPELLVLSELGGGQMIVVAVYVGSLVGLGSEEDAVSLLENLAIKYPAGSTPDARTTRDCQVLGIPAACFITPVGDVLERGDGILTRDQLTTKTETLIEVSVDSYELEVVLRPGRRFALGRGLRTSVAISNQIPTFPNWDQREHKPYPTLAEPRSCYSNEDEKQLGSYARGWSTGTPESDLVRCTGPNQLALSRARGQRLKLEVT